MSDLVKALKGALDYTRLYRGQTFVIKLGGEVLANREALDSLAVSIALLESLSVRVVVVHGGGPQASELSRQLGLSPEVVAGRRVTTPEVLEVAKMVYAGRLNVDLLAMLRGEGVRGVGVSGIDGDLVTARRRLPVQVRDDDGSERTVDFGEVGDIEKVDPAVLKALIDTGYVPVVASLAADASGRPLNVNADHVAGAIAAAVKAERLIFLSNVEGVLIGGQVAPRLTPAQVEGYIADGTIYGGMIPKVKTALDALHSGVSEAVITNLNGLRAHGGTAFVAAGEKTQA